MELIGIATTNKENLKNTAGKQYKEALAGGAFFQGGDSATPK